MERTESHLEMLPRDVRAAALGAVIRQRISNSTAWRLRAMMALRGGIQR